MLKQNAKDKQDDKVATFVCPTCNQNLDISIEDVQKRLEGLRQHRTFFLIECQCGQECTIDRAFRVSKFDRRLPEEEITHEHY